MVRVWLLARVIVGGLVLAACQASAPSSETAPGGDSSASDEAAAPSQPAGNVTLTDIFPAAPARDLVLNSCGTCHAVACLAMGRKGADRWASLKTSHAETVTGISRADYDAIFAYLQEHFNDTTPEPQIPAALLQQGCTPF